VEHLMSNQTVAIRRLVTAETERFPKLASSFFTEAITATQQLLARYCSRVVTSAAAVHHRPKDHRSGPGIGWAPSELPVRALLSGNPNTAMIDGSANGGPSFDVAMLETNDFFAGILQPIPAQLIDLYFHGEFSHHFTSIAGNMKH
jgi:hypothetical protein